MCLKTHFPPFAGWKRRVETPLGGVVGSGTRRGELGGNVTFGACILFPASKLNLTQQVFVFPFPEKDGTCSANWKC